MSQEVSGNSKKLLPIPREFPVTLHYRHWRNNNERSYYFGGLGQQVYDYMWDLKENVGELGEFDPEVMRAISLDETMIKLAHLVSDESFWESAGKQAGSEENKSELIGLRVKIMELITSQVWISNS